MLRALVYSDLHTEFSAFQPKKLWLENADVVVQTGDMHYGAHSVSQLKNWNRPVVFVPGNHEFWNPVVKRPNWEPYAATRYVWTPVYEKTFAQTLDEMRAAAENSGVHVLYNDRVVLDGVEFLGTTLWYEALKLSHWDKKRLVDYARIFQAERELLTAEFVQQEHDKAVSFLAHALANPLSDRRVLVTHHPPVAYTGNDSTGVAYGTALEHLWKDKVQLLVHGHVHTHTDRMVGTTRVVCNPRGYPDDPDRQKFQKQWMVSV